MVSFSNMRFLLTPILFIIYFALPLPAQTVPISDDVGSVTLEQAIGGDLQSAEGQSVADTTDKSLNYNTQLSPNKATLIADRYFSYHIRKKNLRADPSNWNIILAPGIDLNNFDIDQETRTEKANETLSELMQSFFSKNPSPTSPVVVITVAQPDLEQFKEWQKIVADGILKIRQSRGATFSSFVAPLNKPSHSENKHNNVPFVIFKPRLEDIATIEHIQKTRAPVFLLPYAHSRDSQDRDVRGLWKPEKPKVASLWQPKTAEDYILRKFPPRNIISLYKSLEEKPISFDTLRFQGDDYSNSSSTPLMVKVGEHFTLPLGSRVIIIGGPEELGGISEEEQHFLSIYFHVVRLWGKNVKATAQAVKDYLRDEKTTVASESIDLQGGDTAEAAIKEGEDTPSSFIGEDGKTWRHTREAAEAKGFVVDWEPKDRRAEWVFLKKNGVEIKIGVGQNTVTLTKNAVTINVEGPAAVIRGDFTFLPEDYLNQLLRKAENFHSDIKNENGARYVQIRHYAEKAGHEVDWFPKNGVPRVILIKSKTKIVQVDMGRRSYSVRPRGNSKNITYIPLTEEPKIDNSYVFLLAQDMKKLLNKLSE